MRNICDTAHANFDCRQFIKGDTKQYHETNSETNKPTNNNNTTESFPIQFAETSVLQVCMNNYSLESNFSLFSYSAFTLCFYFCNNWKANASGLN